MDLAMARYPTVDLADRVFCHIVSTGILRPFVDGGFVQVFRQSTSCHNHNLVALGPSAENVQHATEQDMDVHDCIRPGTDGDRRQSESSPEDTKRKGKQTDSTPDGEDTRPDFLSLPVQAFLDDPRYLSFTATRLDGEAKNEDLAVCVEQVQRCARGLKRAQPWVHYVLAMAITRDKAVFMRGQGSGTDRLELILADGRGCCIEFIRILLGLALAGDLDFPQNPDVELRNETRTCQVHNIIHRSVASNVPSSETVSRVASTTSASSKSAHSDIGEGGHQDRQKKRRKIDELITTQANRMVILTLRVYRHTCLGILFGSICGRGTTVFCEADLGDEKARVALNMSWQDLERIDGHVAEMKRLVDNPHPNAIGTFNADRQGQTCTTIRAFLDEQIHRVDVDNRVLGVSVSELKRPVKYFWGMHDFVRGLRGALLGHEFLTSIGILHRDISENSIVLGLYPWQERGHLIDFSILEPTQSSLTQSVDRRARPRRPDETKYVKGMRTGTFPYMSFNVLMGKTHTHFDDVESFFYVLLLFFFSYAGPLPQTELQNAHENGFVRPTGSARLPHMRSWPKEYANWVDGDAETIGKLKGFSILCPYGPRYLDESAELRNCLKNNWPEALHFPIRKLLWETLEAFGEGTRGGGRGVSHARFINILDEWLVTHAELEHEYSNCPDFCGI